MSSRIRNKLAAFIPLIRARGSSQFEVEAAECSFYLSYLEEGMVVFDVGAYVGEVTLLFARFVRPKGQVHSFEASPETFARLETICRAAGYQNVTLNRTAVSEKEGEVDFHIYGGELQSWNTRADRPLERYGIHVEKPKLCRISATTVDAYCERKGIERIDRLKVDVEGAELHVLQGASRMLQEKRIRCCTFEFGQTTFDMGCTPDAITSWLGKFGYRVRNIISTDPVFPGGNRADRAQFSMHLASYDRL